MPDSDKLHQITQLIQDSIADDGAEVEKVTQKISVSGDGNIVAGGSVININTVVNKTVKPKRDNPVRVEGAISPAQQSDLQAKIKEWVDTHNKIKKRPLTYQAAWASFNRAQKVGTYKDIEAKNFGKASKWITNKIGGLISMKSAPTKDGDFRVKAYRAIHARSSQLGDKEIYKAYIAKNFNATSLKELADDELQRTRKWILAKK